MAYFEGSNGCGGWWKSRTNLEQKLIILCSLLFILSFSLVISVIVINNRKGDAECHCECSTEALAFSGHRKSIGPYNRGSGGTTTVAPTTAGTTVSGESPEPTPEPTPGSTPPPSPETPKTTPVTPPPTPDTTPTTPGTTPTTPGTTPTTPGTSSSEVPASPSPKPEGDKEPNDNGEKDPKAEKVPQYLQSTTVKDTEEMHSMYGLAKLSERFQMNAGA